MFAAGEGLYEVVQILLQHARSVDVAVAVDLTQPREGGALEARDAQRQRDDGRPQAIGQQVPGDDAGRASAHPVFPPPEYDEPTRPPLVPPPAGMVSGRITRVKTKARKTPSRARASISAPGFLDPPGRRRRSTAQAPNPARARPAKPT